MKFLKVQVSGPFFQEMAGWGRGVGAGEGGGGRGGGTKPESPVKTAESKPPNRYHIATLEMKIQTAPCREPETAGLNPVLPTLEAFRWSHAATSSMTGILLLISLSVTQSMTRSHVAVGCVTQTLDKVNDPNA